MTTVVLKLRLTKHQESEFDRWLWHLTGVYNWGVRKLANDMKDSIVYWDKDFKNLLCNHSQKLGIPSHTIQGTLLQAYRAWDRHFKSGFGCPKLKGSRNKLSCIHFPDPIKLISSSRIRLPILGSVKFHKQDIIHGNIKGGCATRRASGWHISLWVDSVRPISVHDSNEAIGIDPGLSSLLTLSNGEKIANPRELTLGANRLAQSQRAGDRRLSSRLHERQANRRRNRNHKISLSLVRRFAYICISKDNFRGISNNHGRSVTETSLAGLIKYLTYKGRSAGRDVVFVNPRFTTSTCHACGARSGPRGCSELAVRQWECACGAQHDRDINAARNILSAGLGRSLKEISNELK